MEVAVVRHHVTSNVAIDTAIQTDSNEPLRELSDVYGYDHSWLQGLLSFTSKHSEYVGDAKSLKVGTKLLVWVDELVSDSFKSSSLPLAKIALQLVRIVFQNEFVKLVFMAVK